MRTKLVFCLFLLYTLTNSIHIDGYRPLLNGLGFGLLAPFAFIVGGAMIEHGEIAFKSHRYLAATLQAGPGFIAYMTALLALMALGAVWMVPDVTNQAFIVGAAFGVLAWSTALDWWDTHKHLAQSQQQVIIFTSLTELPD